MKKFKKNQITNLSNLSQISGGANTQIEVTHKISGFFDGIKGNHTIALDWKISKG